MNLLQREFDLIELSACYERQDFYKKESNCRRISCRDVAESLFFCSEAAAQILRERLREIPLHTLHFIDSGDYHYLSLFFLERLREPFTLLLLDHHSDCMESAFGGELLTCGSWVLHALRTLPFLKKVVMLGPADEDGTRELLTKDSRVLWMTQEEAEANRQRWGSALLEYPVYVSFDKDVLCREDAGTDWSQGSLSLDTALSWLTCIPSGRLLGMDVCGELKEEDGCSEMISINNRTNQKIVRKYWTFLV